MVQYDDSNIRCLATFTVFITCLKSRKTLLLGRKSSSMLAEFLKCQCLMRSKAEERVRSRERVRGVKIILYGDEKHTMQAQLRCRRKNYMKYKDKAHNSCKYGLGKGMRSRLSPQLPRASIGTRSDPLSTLYSYPVHKRRLLIENTVMDACQLHCHNAVNVSPRLMIAFRGPDKPRVFSRSHVNNFETANIVQFRDKG